MSAPCLVGREATHGTLCATKFTSVGNFSGKLGQKNRVFEEQRSSQDIHFGVVSGRAWEEWAIKESLVYDDSIGHFLNSALGLATTTVLETTVMSNIFKFADDPPSLSFKWSQPKRYTQGYQALWGVVDKLTFKYEAEGDLTWEASGIAKAETEITVPTYAFSTVKPLNVWECAVLLGGGANARLVSGSVTINRDRKTRALLDNTQGVTIGIGNRSVEWDLVIDFDVITEYTKFKAATTDVLQLTWTQAATLLGTTLHPQLVLKLGTLAYEEAYVDDETSLPTIKMKGKALYNPSDASTIVATVVSNFRYDTTPA